MNVIEYAKSILARRAEAVIAIDRQVATDDWSPKLHCCHDNVRDWVARNPGHKHVTGYLIFDLRIIGCWLVQPHSLVEFEDGILVDITPHGASQQYPFVRHVGSDEEFAEMAVAIRIEVPAAEFRG